ncbi:MAG: hypothetical protein HON83_08155 [Candidatus Marinimicrobia bacterium]|jgi:hypothetical protein|nr:hypothetical protein [Candidatus Neomarinimicrobiota bacterium]MBT7557028.1 hypothetical protein [Candidatus Woesearchaeota archaeon]
MSFYKFLFTVFIVALLSTCAEKPTEVTTLGSIYGVVNDESNNNPLSGVTVSIPEIGNRVTSTNGAYEFDELVEDIYSVTASKAGYVSETEQVEAISNKNKEVNFFLRASQPAQLSISPTFLDFGETETSLQLTIDNGGDDELSWQVSSNQSWLTTFPTTGTTTSETDEITVSVNRSLLSVGDYTANLSFTSNGGDLTIPVAMEVTPVGLILSENSLNFGEETTELSFIISNSGTGELNWTLSSGNSWLSANPTSGTITTNTETITVNVSRAGLSPNTYTGSIFIDSNGGDQTVSVTMTVPDTPAPMIDVSPAVLNFGSSGTELTFTITNIGQETLNWSISDDQNWLEVSPTSGSTTTEQDEIIVNVDRAGLSVGDYTGIISISSNGGDINIDVSMEILPPYLVVSSNSLDFGSTETIQNFTITNIGAGTLNWSISADQSWISLWPSSGSTSTEEDEISVTVDRTGLSYGAYSGELNITSDGGDETISVNMDVPFFEDFADLNDWSNDGWTVSNSNNCSDPPCALHYTGYNSQINTMSINVNVTDGQTLSFWAYVYSPSGTVELFFNNVLVWSKTGYGTETPSIGISGSGNLNIKFVGSGPDYSSVYIDNLSIE